MAVKNATVELITVRLVYLAGGRSGWTRDLQVTCNFNEAAKKKNVALVFVGSDSPILWIWMSYYEPFIFHVHIQHYLVSMLCWLLPDQCP